MTDLLSDGGGWRPMNTAPRNGTVIEIRNSYGVMPWYRLYKWTNKILMLQREYRSDGACLETIKESSCEPCWVAENQVGSSLSGNDEEDLSWRPYEGPVVSYVDPTGGEQFSKDYWLRGHGR